MYIENLVFTSLWLFNRLMKLYQAQFKHLMSFGSKNKLTPRVYTYLKLIVIDSENLFIISLVPKFF